MPQPERITNICVFISGTGTNLQALIDATTSTPPTLPHARITHVLSSRKEVKGLRRASDAGIPTTVHNIVPYKNKYPSSDPSVKTSEDARKQYNKDLADIILSLTPVPDLIVCAGFMLVLTQDEFLDPLSKRGIPIINLHPALPNEFNGFDAIEKAYKACHEKHLTRTGVMVHYLIEAVDEGTPIVKEEVPMSKDDTLAQLEERMHEVEHRLIVEGTRKAIDDMRNRKT